MGHVKLGAKVVYAFAHAFLVLDLHFLQAIASAYERLCGRGRNFRRLRKFLGAILSVMYEIADILFDLVWIYGVRTVLKQMAKR